MRESFHLPTSIHFAEEVPGDLRLRLQALVHDAIRRAADYSGSGDEVHHQEPGRAQPAGERVALARLDTDSATYAVPSYGDGGAPVRLPLRDPAESGKRLFEARGEDARGDVSADRVAEDSPFAGQQVALFSGQAARLRGGRYAVSGNLRRALTWGGLLFGARPYAVLEGPVGGSDRRYLSVGVTALPCVRSLAAPAGGPSKEGSVRRVKEPVVWQTQFHDDRRAAYQLRGLVVAPGEVMWPPVTALVQEFYAELEESDELKAPLSRDTAREQLFAGIERLVAAGDIDGAATILVELGAAAFHLVEWEVKKTYLEILCDSAPGARREAAIVAILNSLGSHAEVEAALEVLHRKGWPLFASASAP